MATTNPVAYNVYKVFFFQFDSPDHVAIGVIRTDQQAQSVGRVFQVKGDPCEGMTYEDLTNYNFGESRRLVRKDLQFVMPAAFLASLEHIARKNPPPYDPSAPTPLDPNIPTRHCAHWVDEIIEKARAVLKSVIPLV